MGAVKVRYPWISLTTDYGTEDGFVASCVGVIAGVAPDARLIHVTHAIPRADVRRGAHVLAQTVPYLPAAAHLAVVDPGVGTDRRGVAVVAGEGVLVGPDNGLLLPAADALGGVVAAYQLAEPAFWLAAVSPTFHGRDIFAPVAAHLAAGADPAAVGPPIDTAGLVRLPAPQVEAVPGRLSAEVLGVDHFGNVQLAATADDLVSAGLVAGARVRVGSGEREAVATVGSTFADAPAAGAVVIVDSAGYVAVAVNRGSAAEHLGARPAQVLTVIAGDS